MPGHYGKMMKDKKMKKGKKVVGKRKKLDMDKDGKLTAKDFAMLRKGKKVSGNRKKLDMDGDGKLTKKDFAMLRNKKKKKA